MQTLTIADDIPLEELAKKLASAGFAIENRRGLDGTHRLIRASVAPRAGIARNQRPATSRAGAVHE